MIKQIPYVDLERIHLPDDTVPEIHRGKRDNEQERLRRALVDLEEFAVEFDEYGSTIIDLNHVPKGGTQTYFQAA